MGSTRRVRALRKVVKGECDDKTARHVGNVKVFRLSSGIYVKLKYALPDSRLGYE